MLTGKFSRGTAFGFDHGRELSHASNKLWFEKNGFSILDDLSTVAFSKIISNELELFFDERKSSSETSVAIDISCFDRRRLAEIMNWIRSTKRPGITFDFWYCIAAFQPPSPSVGRNEIAGPVHRRFAGRFIEPGRPLALIAGLGYELGKIMGAAEYLQATRIIAFVPDSPLQAYEREVLDANSAMLEDIEHRNVLKYSVNNPERTIAMLDATIRGLVHDYNVVILPSGPKIFAICSFIAHTLHPSTAVWRVSSGNALRARDAFSSNQFVGLRFALQ
jgi:hypothetical protein